VVVGGDETRARDGDDDGDDDGDGDAYGAGEGNERGAGGRGAGGRGGHVRCFDGGEGGGAEGRVRNLKCTYRICTRRFSLERNWGGGDGW
jgi:hypothetical protein